MVAGGAEHSSLKAEMFFFFLKYMLHKCITSTAEIFQKMDNEVVSWVGESCLLNPVTPGSPGLPDFMWES